MGAWGSRPAQHQAPSKQDNANVAALPHAAEHGTDLASAAGHSAGAGTHHPSDGGVSEAEAAEHFGSGDLEFISRVTQQQRSQRAAANGISAALDAASRVSANGSSLQSAEPAAHGDAVSARATTAAPAQAGSNGAQSAQQHSRRSPWQDQTSANELSSGQVADSPGRGSQVAGHQGQASSSSTAQSAHTSMSALHAHATFAAAQPTPPAFPASEPTDSQHVKHRGKSAHSGVSGANGKHANGSVQTTAQPPHITQVAHSAINGAGSVLGTAQTGASSSRARLKPSGSTAVTTMVAELHPSLRACEPFAGSTAWHCTQLWHPDGGSARDDVLTTRHTSQPTAGATGLPGATVLLSAAEQCVVGFCSSVEEVTARNAPAMHLVSRA